MRPSPWQFLMVVYFLFHYADIDEESAHAQERGIGGVLRDEQGASKRVLALSTGIELRQGDRREKMLDNVPYYVVDARDEQLLVCRFPDQSLLDEQGGWVAASQVHPWTGRKLISLQSITKASEAVRMAVGFTDSLGEGSPLAPWPVHIAAEQEVAYCDLRALGAMIVPIRLRDDAELATYRMFGDVELNKALTAITSFLLLFETSVEIPLRDLPRLLRDLDSRTKSDFLSNDAIRRALDACPEPTAGYLIEKKYRHLLAAELCSRLHEQKTWLANLLRQRKYFIPDQNAYIVPVSHLSALKESSP